MRFVRLQRVVSVALLGLALAAGLGAQKPYRVLDTWTVGGEGGWDFLTLDSAAHRLYLAHNSRIEVVDTTTGKLLGAITGLHSTHGVALAPDGKLGYISDGAGNAVVVFDRATLATVATIPAGTNPDAITYEPATQTIWAFNGKSHDASVIDAATQKVVATVPVPGKPEVPAVDGQGTIYLNIEDKNEIVRIDARARKLTATWPTGCEAPTGLALDVAGARLFAVCDGNKMAVVSTASGKLLASPAIGDGPDGAAFSAAQQVAFATSADGILAVVDTKSAGYPTLQKLATARGARTLDYDESTDRLYTMTAVYGPKPAATAQNPKPKAPVLPGSFKVIVVGR